MLKIVTVCGMGLGSSMIMKMTVENALENLDVNHKVEHWDMGTVKSQSADLIVTTQQFENDFKETDNLIILDDIMNEKEATEKLSKYLETVE